MSSCLFLCAHRTVPFCRDDQSWLERHLGYPWWNVSQHSIQRLLPQQIAAPYVACIYSLGFYSLLSLSWMYPGNCCARCCPSWCLCPGEYLHWLWGFPKCLDTSVWRNENPGDAPSKPWEDDDDGYLGKCLAFSSCLSPSSARSPLCGFSLTDLYQQLILVQGPISLSLHASLLFSLSKRSGRPNQTDESSLWCLTCTCSLPQGEQGSPSHAIHRICFISAHLKLSGAFQKGVVINILCVIETGAKLFLRDPSSPLFFFFFFQ